MSDFLTKVKAALDDHKIDRMDDDEWAEIGPDMARALIAVEAWLIAEIEACEVLGDKAEAEQGYRTLAAFHAAMEGKE